MRYHPRPYRWLRRLIRTLTIFIGIVIIACLVLDHYVQFRKDDAALKSEFRSRGVDGQIGYYYSHGRKMRYCVTGNANLPLLLMLHGSPGSMSYYGRRYADPVISEHFRVVAVDRPGYGYSGLGDPEPSISEQAAMIRPLLDSLVKGVHPIIISGGSYGASLACRLAMDYPDLVDGLALTGPSMGPGLEKTFWFTPAIENWSVRWFVPRIFRSANTEKLHHREELTRMLPLWQNIRVPVSYLQGSDDNIVDTANAGFARSHLVNAPWLDVRFIPGRQHRLAQYEWPAIRANIMKVYEQAMNRRQR